MNEIDSTTPPDSTSSPDSNSTPAVASRHGGKWAIAVMVLVACILGAFAVWFHLNQGERVIQMWGADRAWLIRHADHVSWIRVEFPTELGLDLPTTLADLPISKRVDVAAMPGLVHARHALIQDASYLWDPQPAAEAPAPSWKFGLVFQHDGDDRPGTRREVVLLFAPDQKLVRLLETGEQQPMAETLQSLQAYFAKLE